MTTKRSALRYLSILLVCAGVLLVVAAALAAIIEGYAADAQMRRGNIVPSLVLGGIGIASALAGMILPPVLPQQVDSSDESSEGKGSS